MPFRKSTTTTTIDYYPGVNLHEHDQNDQVWGSPYLQDGPATNSCRTFWHTFVPGTCADPA